jgi:DNA-binding NtrC family response regulator
MVYGALGTVCKGRTLVAVVLVVEDEAQVLVLATSCLADHGHTALSASTTDEARAILDGEKNIDVLFADRLRFTGRTHSLYGPDRIRSARLGGR